MRLQKFAYALLAILSFGALEQARAVVRITDDPGGRIGNYVDWYQRLRNSGERVVIDGPCSSACTLVLGIIPPDRVCVTRRATLGFHQAWDEGSATVNGRQVKAMVANAQSSEMLFRQYPSPVRDWIFLHGGLPPPWQILKLSGRELAQLVPVCSRASKMQ